MWWFCKDYLVSFHFGRMLYSWKTDFGEFSHWESVMIMKGLIFYVFHSEIGCWSWILIFNNATWRGCGVLKGWILDNFHFGRMSFSFRTDFGQFLLWEEVVVLKGLILDNFTLGGSATLKGLIWIISTLERCGSLERTDFQLFPLWEGVVVILK